MILRNNTAKFDSLSCMVLLLCLWVVLLQGCNASMKNSIVGRSQNHATTVEGKHKITVIPSPGLIVTRAGLEERDGVAIYRHHFLLGHKIDLVIKKHELSVNGRRYGSLNEGDSVTYVCDSGKVLINEKEAQEIARR